MFQLPIASVGRRSRSSSTSHNPANSKSHASHACQLLPDFFPDDLPFFAIMFHLFALERKSSLILVMLYINVIVFYHDEGICLTYCTYASIVFSSCVHCLFLVLAFWNFYCTSHIVIFLFLLIVLMQLFLFFVLTLLFLLLFLVLHIFVRWVGIVVLQFFHRCILL